VEREHAERIAREPRGEPLPAKLGVPPNE